MIRPANYPSANPGRGHTVVEAGGMRVAVINLSGGVGLKVARSPFDAVDAILERLEADAAIVDFHAEVTSEKVAMGWHLDGRVAAVLGTHTHVPTADGRVLPKGTAFISDVGMTGSRQSILGVRIEDALGALITQMPTRFETADEDVWVMGAVVDINRAGTGGLDRAGDGSGSRRRLRRRLNRGTSSGSGSSVGSSSASAISISGKNQTM